MNDDNEAPSSPAALLEPSDYGEYMLRSQTEMLQLLQKLQEKVSLITIFFNEGADLILTSLVAVDNDKMIFDLGSSAETNERALHASKLFCVTTLDKVRVQFLIRGLKSTSYERRPALVSALPETILRLQRREFYRLTMPLTRRLTCQIPQTSGQNIEVDIVDLSGGGMAIVAPPDGLRLQRGLEYANCVIEMPDVGTITTTIEILTVSDMAMRNGPPLKKAGCRFVNLPVTMGNMVQHYITKIERERKARESGMT